MSNINWALLVLVERGMAVANCSLLLNDVPRNQLERLNTRNKEPP